MLEVFVTTFKALALWAGFAFIGANLLGLVVRGIVSPLQIPVTEDPGAKAMLAREGRKLAMADLATTGIAVVLFMAYYYCIYYFLGILCVVAAAMTMTARLPDLLWELKHGVKVGRQKGQGPEGVGYIVIGTLCLFGALPVTWWALWK